MLFYWSVTWLLHESMMFYDFVRIIQHLQNMIYFETAERFWTSSKLTHPSRKRTTARHWRSYLQDFAASKETYSAQQLKVIVVDDFFLSPLSSMEPFRISGGQLCCVEEVEDFLLQPLVEMGIEAFAKVLRCYKKITTRNGLVLQVGIGLSNNLLKDGKEFLSSPASPRTCSNTHLPEPEMEKSFFHVLATFAWWWVGYWADVYRLKGETLWCHSEADYWHSNIGEWSELCRIVRVGGAVVNDIIHWSHWWYHIELPSRKLTCPRKRDQFNRKYIFQPLIFRGHVSFWGCTYIILKLWKFRWYFLPIAW